MMSSSDEEAIFRNPTFGHAIADNKTVIFRGICLDDCDAPEIKQESQHSAKRILKFERAKESFANKL
ncbi:hypothetical protein AC249_AIPGENE27151 [Exaiptasia diaphana]|nr:hypothetical protein AC249_AIPGENE27151 [Exaiptasia diaphana]